MPRKYPAQTRMQVIELARSGTRVAQLAATFGMLVLTLADPIPFAAASYYLIERPFLKLKER